MRTLTIPQVRRAAMAASGLLRGRPAKADVRHFRRVVADIDVVQLDSVNIVARAHEMPFWSRLGAYDTEALRRWLWLSREMHECWAHVASLMAMDAEPLLRHRQRAHEHPWEQIRKIMAEAPGYVEAVERQVVERGPASISDLDEPGGRTSEWWGWNPGKLALQWLFFAGRIAVHERNGGFVASYHAPDKVLPAEVRDHPYVDEPDAREHLLLRAARAHGIGTLKDLADHHRQSLKETAQAVERLVARGALVPVRVDGWNEPAYADPDLTIPRQANARALVSPFDPIVWYRERVERLFGFHYRIEIYVPAPKRQWGYYVYPFILGDRFVGRVDLKADRKAGQLLVRASWAEDGVDHTVVARELAAELAAMGAWLGTPEVVVEPKGDLAPALRKAVG